MKAPVGLLSDRTVLRSKMEGPRPDKFRFVESSIAYCEQKEKQSCECMILSRIDKTAQNQYNKT